MGYCIEVELKQPIVIAHYNMDQCLEAINKLHETGRKYRWVSNPDNGKFNSLEEALDAWRYFCQKEPEGVVITEFTGEKYGDCEVLYRAIAPFVSRGLIVMTGEDGEQWKYVFDCGKVSRSERSEGWGEAEEL